MLPEYIYLAHISTLLVLNYEVHRALTIFLCMAMMYPMKGLSCNGMTCPLATPLGSGVSGLQGTTVLGPPLGMRTGLLAGLWSPAQPLAIGVISVRGEDRDGWRPLWVGEEGRQKWEKVDTPVSVGELTDVGEPGTGISKAHRKPFTDNLTFWLSWGKF